MPSTPLTIRLVMPMAGRGTRFRDVYGATPKPLVSFCGHPLFVWSVESVRQRCRIEELCFVVLHEHVATFGIDVVIRRYYPGATIVTLPDVTPGAAATAAHGVRALKSNGVVAINDCDHAFELGQDAISFTNRLREGGALLGFRSSNPSYSYAVVDDQKLVRNIVEKQVVSEFAVAGCYWFSQPSYFLGAYEARSRDGVKGEFYLSDIVDFCIVEGGQFQFSLLERHYPLGTPEELQRVTRSDLGFLLEPRAT